LPFGFGAEASVRFGKTRLIRQTAITNVTLVDEGIPESRMLITLGGFWPLIP
jgi:hypothetical protein